MDNKMAEQALRSTLIEILIATRGESEGHTADTILSALSAPRVPDGWILFPADAWNFLNGSGALDGHWFGEQRAGKSKFWWRLEIASMLTASPEPVALDTERCPECGMLDGHAEGCPEYWIDIPANLRRQTNTEQHTQQVIADLRAEVEALRAEKDALIDLSNGLDKMYRKLWKIIAQSVWRLAYRGEKDAVIKELRESIIDAARLREGGGE